MVPPPAPPPQALRQDRARPDLVGAPPRPDGDDLTLCPTVTSPPWFDRPCHLPAGPRPIRLINRLIHDHPHRDARTCRWRCGESFARSLPSVACQAARHRAIRPHAAARSRSPPSSVPLTKTYLFVNFARHLAESGQEIGPIWRASPLPGRRRAPARRRWRRAAPCDRHPGRPSPPWRPGGERWPRRASARSRDHDDLSCDVRHGWSRFLLAAWP